VKDRIRQFVTAHNREANKEGTGKCGLILLNALAFADSSMKIGDSVARGLWD
jgi:hypothetical protein